MIGGRRLAEAPLILFGSLLPLYLLLGRSAGSGSQGSPTADHTGTRQHLDRRLDRGSRPAVAVADDRGAYRRSADGACYFHTMKNKLLSHVKLP